MDMPELGKRVRHAMTVRRLSLARMVQKTGLSRQGLINIRQGRGDDITGGTLLKLSAALGYPVSYLLGESGEEGVAFGLDVMRAQHVMGLMEGVRVPDPEAFLLQMSQLSEEEQTIIADFVDFMTIRHRYPPSRADAHILPEADQKNERREPRKKIKDTSP